MTADHLLNDIMHTIRRLNAPDGLGDVPARDLLDRLTILSIRLSQFIGPDGSEGEDDMATVLGRIRASEGEARTELFHARRRVRELEAELTTRANAQAEAEGKLATLLAEMDRLRASSI